MRNVKVFLGLLAASMIAGAQARGQAPNNAITSTSSEPATALAEVISAACRGDQTAFANYFTTDNAVAYRALPAEERKRLLQRFALSDVPGKAILSSDQDNHPVIKCETPGGDSEFRFGATRLEENLAFIPVSQVGGQAADFGMVREKGSWKLLSLGLVLLDIKQLAVQWAEADIADRESSAAAALRTLGNAIDSYQRTFGKLPDSLAKLEPGPKNQVSPDQAEMVSAALAAGSDGGYSFRYKLTGGADSSSEHYVIEAVPQDYGTSGRESFFRDADGKVHGADNHGAAADADDPIWTGTSAQ
jgi:hypothetical protein